MIIRQAAFEKETKMLKGALHCHTTRSDGKLTPEEVTRLHKEHGYDFLAITDHCRYNFKSYAPDTDILMIPGMEMDRRMDTREGMCFHTVSIGPTRENGNGFEQDQVFQTGTVTSQYEYQPIVDMLLEANNMVLYCHPDWSCTPYTSFHHLKGCFGMEVWNSGCVMENGMDSNAYCWDDLLKENIRLWGVATDDGHKYEHHCKGWVMVAAEKNVASVLEALKNGAFYSTTGPEIYDFWVEDKKTVHLKCSPVSRVRFITGTRPTGMVQGENMTELDYEIYKAEVAHYIRLELTDAQGHMAWTQPIFFD